MRGLVAPEKTEDYTAAPVELFIDLAFVFAFSQIVHMLVVHPDWEHVGKAGLIFLPIWLPWTQFTWAANAVLQHFRPNFVAMVVLAILIVITDVIGIGALAAEHYRIEERAGDSGIHHSHA
jgi:low temperature requirement protein LtrA